MPERSQFIEMVGDAYQNLYDLVTLRSHPLTDLVLPDSQVPRRDKAWHLHQTLIDLIEELDPGAQAPPLSPLWRRYRLMSLRYVEGIEAQAVADALAISRRHFYRERDSAIEAVAEILWHRYAANRDIDEQAHAPSSPDASQPAPSVPSEPTLSDTRLELLRQETARISQIDGGTRPPDVIAGVIELLRTVAAQRKVHLELGSICSSPMVAVDVGILRHLLVIVTGSLVKRIENTTIQFEILEFVDRVRISVKVVPSRSAQLGVFPAEELAPLHELAAVGQISLSTQVHERSCSAIHLDLPLEHHRHVLIVDDNADALELFQRYLWTHSYQISTAQSAAEAQTLAEQILPHVIVLDLMMPERDGWDLLQSLRNQPSTQTIPIVVCSILRQHDLALALGASAFLAKPFSQQALLESLNSVLKPVV